MKRPKTIEEQETVPARAEVTQVDPEDNSEDDVEMDETARRLDVIMAAIAASDRRGDERQVAAARRWDDRLQTVVTQCTEHSMKKAAKGHEGNESDEGNEKTKAMKKKSIWRHIGVGIIACRVWWPARTVVIQAAFAARRQGC